MFSRHFVLIRHSNKGNAIVVEVPPLKDQAGMKDEVRERKGVRVKEGEKGDGG